MSAPNTFAAGEAFRLLGVKGGQLPGVAVDQYQPVIVMGDFSSGLSSAPIEARGMTSSRIGAVSNRHAQWQIQSLGPGGIIIETLIAKVDAGDDFVDLGIFETAPIAGATTLGHTDNIGGVAVRSIVRQGNQNANRFPLPPRIQLPLWTATSDSKAAATLQGQKIYLAPGLFFGVGSRNQNREMIVWATWRELAEPIGSP